jgi:hypothetical protein
MQDDKAKLAAFRAERSKYFDMSNSGKEDLADAMLRDGPLNTTGADLRKALNAHTEYNLKLAFDTLETNKAAYNASLLQTSGMIGRGVAGAVHGCHPVPHHQPWPDFHPAHHAAGQPVAGLHPARSGDQPG